MTGDLPAETTSFVGRQRELAEVARLLATARLVTLTGAAGVGKTRLAIRVARRIRGSLVDGAWFVELAELRDGALVAETVAAALGLRDDTGREPVARLLEVIRDRRMLLVLDNCEHLAQACAALVRGLLATAGQLRVLATSRQSLGVREEHVWRVPPLEVEAEELFAERAAAAAPGFVLTDANRAQVAEICRRLDGIPLAIELAAVRLRALSVDQVRSRLDDRLQLLAGERRGGLPHQRTMRTTVDWSYDLCTPQERSLWARTAVFAGDFEPAAAVQICAGEGLARNEIVPLLERLVANSVLLREGERYRLLETLREYGLERLRDAGLDGRIGRAHAEWYLDLAEQGAREWFGPHQVEWFGRLRREHDNLRAALDFCAGHGLAGMGRRMAGALWVHWVFAGRLAEGRHWFDRVLGPDPEPSRALAAAALVACLQGDMDAALRWSALARQGSDPAVLALATHSATIGAIYHGELERVGVLVAETLIRCREAGEPDGAVAVLAHLAAGAADYLRNDPASATDHFVWCLRACRSRGEQVLLGHTLVQLGRAEWAAGHHRAAAGHAAEVVRLHAGLPEAPGLAMAVEMLAWAAAAGGRLDRAAVLFGAADQVWRASGFTDLMRNAVFAPRTEWMARTRQGLGAAFEPAFRRGAELSTTDIVEYALRSDDVLTRREWEVAQLIAEGLSNRQIAARLRIAQRTAEAHVERILTKLGFASRAQIAAWVASSRR